MPHDRPLLIVVASASPGVADEVSQRLRDDGATVYSTHSAGGCLRVATTAGPDVVLLDDGLPRRLAGLLRAHPRTAGARQLPLSESMLSQLSLALKAGAGHVVAA
jgi:hypothetical protein